MTRSDLPFENRRGFPVQKNDESRRDRGIEEDSITVQVRMVKVNEQADKKEEARQTTDFQGGLSCLGSFFDIHR